MSVLSFPCFILCFAIHFYVSKRPPANRRFVVASSTRESGLLSIFTKELYTALGTGALMSVLKKPHNMKRAFEVLFSSSTAPSPFCTKHTIKSFDAQHRLHFHSSLMTLQNWKSPVTGGICRLASEPKRRGNKQGSYLYFPVGRDSVKSVQRLATAERFGGRRDFSARFQTDPGAHPSPMQWAPGLFPGGMRTGRGVNHRPLSSAEVKEK